MLQSLENAYNDRIQMMKEKLVQDKQERQVSEVAQREVLAFSPDHFPTLSRTQKREETADRRLKVQVAAGKAALRNDDKGRRRTRTANHRNI